MLCPSAPARPLGLDPGNRCETVRRPKRKRPKAIAANVQKPGSHDGAVQSFHMPSLNKKLLETSASLLVTRSYGFESSDSLRCGCPDASEAKH